MSDTAASDSGAGTATDHDPDKLVIGLARDFERDPILDLWERAFGCYGDFEPEVVDAALDRDQHSVWCYTIGSEHELAAFAILHWVSIEDFHDHHGLDDGVDVDTDGWPIAVNNVTVDWLCVDPEYRQRGFAGYLLEKCHGYARHNDVRRLWGVSWHREDHVDSRPLLRSYDYERVADAPDGFYVRVNGDDGPERSCPECGRGGDPCRCDASVWTRTVDLDADAETEGSA